MIRNNTNIENEDNFNLKEFLLGFLYYWKWIVLSVVIALSSSYVYLKFLMPKYQVEASILLKRDANNRFDNDNVVLEELGIVPTNTNYIEDEIEIIKSRPIITQVVVNNNLNTRYYYEHPLKISRCLVNYRL